MNVTVAKMGDRGRGIPKICRCGEAVVMNTSKTVKNPGRLFHACPFGRDGVSINIYVDCLMISLSDMRFNRVVM